MKKFLKNFATTLKGKFTHKKSKNNQIQELIENDEFMRRLLDYSVNDIDILCTYLGEIMIYYALSDDTKLDYSIEELLNKTNETNLYSIDEIKEKGFFTHSCNGNMIEHIKKWIR